MLPVLPLLQIPDTDEKLSCNYSTPGQSLYQVSGWMHGLLIVLAYSVRAGNISHERLKAIVKYCLTNIPLSMSQKVSWCTKKVNEMESRDQEEENVPSPKGALKRGHSSRKDTYSGQVPWIHLMLPLTKDFSDYKRTELCVRRGVPIRGALLYMTGFHIKCPDI